jgi:hypothetical protein
VKEDWIDPADLARELRKLLKAVEEGDLTVSSPIDRRIASSIDGAAVALEELARRNVSRQK